MFDLYFFILGLVQRVSPNVAPSLKQWFINIYTSIVFMKREGGGGWTKGIVSRVEEVGKGKSDRKWEEHECEANSVGKKSVPEFLK